MSASDLDKTLNYGPMGHEHIPVRIQFSHLEGIVCLPYQDIFSEFWSYRYWAQPFLEDNSFFGTYYIENEFPFYYAQDRSLIVKLEEQSTEDLQVVDVIQRYPQYSKQNLPLYVNPENEDEIGKALPLAGQFFWEGVVKGAISWGLASSTGFIEYDGTTDFDSAAIVAKNIYHKGVALLSDSDTDFLFNTVASAALLQTTDVEDVSKIWLVWIKRIARISSDGLIIKDLWYADEVVFSGERLQRASPENKIEIANFDYVQETPEGSLTFDLNLFSLVGTEGGVELVINSACTEAKALRFFIFYKFDEDSDKLVPKLGQGLYTFKITSNSQGIPQVELLTTEIAEIEYDSEDEPNVWNYFNTICYDGLEFYLGRTKRKKEQRSSGLRYREKFYINDVVFEPIYSESDISQRENGSTAESVYCKVRNINLITKEYGLVYISYRASTFTVGDDSFTSARIIAQETWEIEGVKNILWKIQDNSPEDGILELGIHFISFHLVNPSNIIELKSERGDLLPYTIRVIIYNDLRIGKKKIFTTPEDLFDRMGIPNLEDVHVHIYGKI